METCRHYRYRLPRELADELRDADPLPCEVCDALPHRRKMAAETQQNVPVIMPVRSVTTSPQPFMETRTFSSTRKTALDSGAHGLRLWFDRLQSAHPPTSLVIFSRPGTIVGLENKNAADTAIHRVWLQSQFISKTRQLLEAVQRAGGLVPAGGVFICDGREELFLRIGQARVWRRSGAREWRA